MKPTKHQTKKICRKLGRDFIEISFLANGSHNQCFLLNTLQGKLVIKVECNPGYSKKEYKVLRTLKKGLGPKVYLFDDSKAIIPRSYMVQELLTGENPSGKVSDTFVRIMAKWFKGLHSIKTSNLPAKEFKLIRSLHYWGNFHYKSYQKEKKCLSSTLKQKLEAIFQESLELCKKNDRLFARLKTFPLVHNDPSRDNIFIQSDHVQVIDWEFAGHGLGERDLFAFLSSYKLTEKQKDLFLRTYGYSNAKLGKKKLGIISHIQYLGGYDYLVNRISLIEQGKVSKRQQSSKKKPLINKLKRLLVEHKKLILEITRLN